jgi:hypothetical protein
VLWDDRAIVRFGTMRVAPPRWRQQIVCTHQTQHAPSTTSLTL